MVNVRNEVGFQCMNMVRVARQERGSICNELLNQPMRGLFWSHVFNVKQEYSAPHKVSAQNLVCNPIILASLRPRTNRLCLLPCAQQKEGWHVSNKCRECVSALSSHGLHVFSQLQGCTNVTTVPKHACECS